MKHKISTVLLSTTLLLASGCGEEAESADEASDYMTEVREALVDRFFEEEGDKNEAECVTDKVLAVTDEEALKEAGVTKDDIEPIQSLLSGEEVEIFYDECGSA